MTDPGGGVHGQVIVVVQPARVKTFRGMLHNFSYWFCFLFWLLSIFYYGVHFYLLMMEFVGICFV